MKKLISLIIISWGAFASEPYIFKSSCQDVSYTIKSSCIENNLSDDQGILDMPICENQTIFIGSKKHELSEATGFKEITNQNGKNIKMMKFFFYGVSCKRDRVILSAYGGCNSCGEMFKTFSLSGDEVKDDSIPINLEPMQDIMPNTP